MTDTATQIIDEADGWVTISTDPSAITIKCNSPGKWHVFIKSTVGAPPLSENGEVYVNQFEPWIGSGIIGTIYVRVVGDGFEFAVTE